MNLLSKYNHLVERKCTAQELDITFNSFDSVNMSQLTGFWIGKPCSTGSFIIDKLLTFWEGKYFYGPNKVDALIYRFGTKHVRLPFGAARLKTKVFRDVKSVDMPYVLFPFMVDHFRKVDDNTVMGIMTVFDRPVSYFFLTKFD